MKRLPDDTEVTIPIRSVNQDLHCPVCLGILNATYATKDVSAARLLGCCCCCCCCCCD